MKKFKEKNMKKKFITITFSLLLWTLTAQANEEALIIYSVSGTSRGIELNSIRNIDFSTNNSMVINVYDGEPVYFVLSNVEKFLFGDMPPNVNIPQVNNIDLSVYITPQGEVQITGEVQVLSLTIFDINGRQLMSSDSARLNISSLPRAVYLLVVETTQGFASKKIIKQ